MISRGGQLQIPAFIITTRDSNRQLVNLQPFHDSIFLQNTVVSLSPRYERKKLESLHKGINLYMCTIGRDISLSELGCAFGHFEVYKQFLTTQQAWGLVLEDDAELMGLKSSIFSELKKITKPAIISLIEQRGGERDFRELAPESNLVKMIFPGKGTSAYLINRNAAKIYLNNYNRFGICSTADWPFPYPKNLNFFYVKEPLFYQHWNDPNSTIQKDRLGKIRQQNDLERPLRYFKTFYIFFTLIKLKFPVNDLIFSLFIIKFKVFLIKFFRKLLF